jgi:hypothetical protein
MPFEVTAVESSVANGVRNLDRQALASPHPAVRSRQLATHFPLNPDLIQA